MGAPAREVEQVEPVRALVQAEPDQVEVEQLRLVAPPRELEEDPLPRAVLGLEEPRQQALVQGEAPLAQMLQELLQAQPLALVPASDHR